MFVPPPPASVCLPVFRLCNGLLLILCLFCCTHTYLHTVGFILVLLRTQVMGVVYTYLVVKANLTAEALLLS